MKFLDTALRKELLKWSTNIQTPNKLYNAHPSCSNFPGAAKAGFELTNKSFHLIHKQVEVAQSKISKKMVFASPNNATLYSTGLYALPGEPIYVSIPAEFYNRKIYLSIGIHADNLGYSEASTEDWRRMPKVVSFFALDSAFQFASSPFGGLIYLSVDSDEPSIDTQLTFKNVITAPYYKVGSTAEDWQKLLAINKAPWGEIASDNVIITLPDSALQKIKDPVQLMLLWDRILKTEFDLSQLPFPLIRPVRMVLDEQISGGFMHSGYPIMIQHSPSANMLTLDVITNPEKLLTPSNGGANWGFFHEIGHNLQNWEWVFDGTTEVGCNFFSLYVFDSLLKTRSGAHINIKPGNQKKLMHDYFIEGASYKTFQENPFLALIPFMQLQKQFGWTSYKRVFNWYLDYCTYDYDMSDNDEAQHQKYNQFKIDRFVERFSIITNRNLVPFFEIWGLPVSEGTRTRLSNLKKWVPNEIRKFAIE